MSDSVIIGIDHGHRANKRTCPGEVCGLDVPAAKVGGRIHVLDRLLARFRKAA